MQWLTRNVTFALQTLPYIFPLTIELYYSLKFAISHSARVERRRDEQKHRTQQVANFGVAMRHARNEIAQRRQQLDEKPATV